MSARLSAPVLAESQLLTSSPEHVPYSIYIHVPFCIRKCLYCSFYSVTGQRKWFNQYVGAVQRQIEQAAFSSWSQKRQVGSIFFGGGTPTQLAPEQLVSLLQQCLQGFVCIYDGLEISIEVNPATIELDGLVLLRKGGFSRLSIGVQSLVDNELERIGRVHTAADALTTVRLARKAGFENLSLDLMYGLPGQDVAGWQHTLEQTLALQPDHLSIYELTIEQGTPFFERVARGGLELPDEDDVLTMLSHTDTVLKSAGFHRYEISNYARPGHECRHNVNYWNNGSYLGFGAAAVTFRSGLRMTTVADVEQFCKRISRGQTVYIDEEELTPEQRFRETVIMGLRMTRGISVKELERRFGINLINYYGATLERFVRHQLLEINNGRLCLTRQGLLLANIVMAELV